MVIINYFHQVTPSGSGQYLNAVILSSNMPNRIIFNQKSYGCRWGRTVDRDGQWQQITVSFSRRTRVNWPIEHYVRTGRDMYMLQYRLPSCPRNSASDEGTFRDVPLKILRCLSSSRSVTSPVLLTLPNPFAFGGPETSIVSNYLQIAYDATDEPVDEELPSVSPMGSDQESPWVMAQLEDRVVDGRHQGPLADDADNDL